MTCIYIYNLYYDDWLFLSQIACLMEKLKAKEEAGGAVAEAVQKPETLPGDMVSEIMGMQLISVKVEDRLSTGSGTGSAVVDDHEEGPQLVDSGDSYFQSCVQYPAAMEGVQSEEDDGSDDGRSYFSDVFAAAEQPEEGEGLAWWVW